MLLPALSAARERARSANCLANLKQFGMGVHMYANMSNSYIPVVSGNGALYTLNISLGTNASSSPFRLMYDLGLYGEEFINKKEAVIKFTERYFKCPSDSAHYRAWPEKGDTAHYTSYLYWVGIGQVSSKLPPRLIIGRDEPDVAISADKCKKVCADASILDSVAHVSQINVLFLGGHCGMTNAKVGESAASNAAGAMYCDVYKMD